MKCLWLAVLFAVAVTTFGVSAILADDDNEERVKLSDCPKAVQKTLKREAGDGEIEEIVREKENGKTIYEAEVEIDGKDYEIEVAEDGTLLSKVLEDDDDDDDDDDDK